MIADKTVLTDEQRRAFETDGYLLLRGALDVRRDIEPICRDLDRVIRITAEAHGVKLPDVASFDDRFLALVTQRPEANSIVYDAAKNLVSFNRLTVHPLLEQLAGEVRSSQFVGTAVHGQGIRIDRPGDTRHTLPWHQDFPFQLRSADGIVFWIPLVPIGADMGPVELCVGSHRLGALPLENTSGTADDAVHEGVYSALRVKDEDALVARFPVVAPATQPGDILFFDFLALHRSGRNESTHTRWSAQIRYFNFLEQFGRESGWRGSFKSGRTVREINASLAEVRRFHAGR